MFDLDQEQERAFEIPFSLFLFVPQSLENSINHLPNWGFDDMKNSSEKVHLQIRHSRRWYSHFLLITWVFKEPCEVNRLFEVILLFLLLEYFSWRAFLFLFPLVSLGLRWHVMEFEKYCLIRIHKGFLNRKEWMNL